MRAEIASTSATPNIQPQVPNTHGTSNMQAQDLSCDMYSNYKLYSNSPHDFDRICNLLILLYCTHCRLNIKIIHTT